jgi:hypothetical protein
MLFAMLKDGLDDPKERPPEQDDAPHAEDDPGVRPSPSPEATTGSLDARQGDDA